MKIKTIEIENFKVFKEYIKFELDGKNMLLYGNNGSGKSSLFWALHTFLQSSTKSSADIQKYFDVFDESNDKTYQSLRNVFSTSSAGVLLRVTTIDEDKVEASFEVGTVNINTNLPHTTLIAEANIASDFMNYKVLHHFYNGRHGQEINLWDVFKHDIFPYFSPINKNSYQVILDNLIKNLPRKESGKGAVSAFSSNRRKKFDEDWNNTNNDIDAFLAEITENANDFLKTHFFEKKDFLRIHLQFTKRINFERIKHNQLNQAHLQIKLWVELYDNDKKQWIENHRPHSFLNEAQLTRVALAVRIGAMRTRVTNAALQLLVLDDLLISLDMSNRMPVVKLLLEHEQFKGFQKIIMTHDKAFFKLIKRDAPSSDWKCYELEKSETTNDSPKLKPTQEYIDKAKKSLDEGDFDTCAMQLRKELEYLMKRQLKKDIPATSVGLDDKEHQELSDMIKSVKTDLENKQLILIKKFLNQDIDSKLIWKLKDNYHTDTTLPPSDKGKLKSFQTNMIKAFEDRKKIGEDIGELLDNVRKHIDFVLNQAAHDTSTATYEGEIKDAYTTIKRLKEYLEKKDK